MAGYKRKYDSPAARLLAHKQPKTEEHKKKLSEAHKRYWEEARKELAKNEMEQNIKENQE